MRRLAIRFTEEAGTEAAVTIAGRPRPLPVAAEVVLLRAAQESLTGVRRHAAAESVTSVTILLTYTDDTAGLDVRDDGQGFQRGNRCRAWTRDDAIAGRRGRRIVRHKPHTQRHPGTRGGARVITVLIVDDHPVVRALLAGVPDITVAGEAARVPRRSRRCAARRCSRRWRGGCGCIGTGRR